MRRLARLSVVCALALLVTSGAEAQRAPVAAAERDRAFEFFTKRETTISKFAVKSLWRAATKAQDEEFPEQAYWACSHVIQWDPEHRGARKLLGYVRKDGEWVLDASLNKVARRENRLKNDETQAKWRERYDEWYETYYHAYRNGIIDRWVKLGADCAKKDWPLQSHRAFRNALRYDKLNNEALTGLGMEFVDDVWMPSRLVEVYSANREVTENQSADAWEKTVGVELRGVRTKHVRVFETSDTGSLPSIARAGEVARLVVLEFIGRPLDDDTFRGKTAEFLWVDVDLWDDWAVAMKYEGMTDEKARKRTSLGWINPPINTYRRRTSWKPSDGQDGIAHSLTHRLLRWAYETRRASWIDEGLAFEASASVVVDASFRCTPGSKGRYGSQTLRKRWADANEWRRSMREIVEASDDKSLRAIVPLHVTDFDLEDAIKAWSVLTWLRATYPEATIAYLAEAAKEADHPALLEKHFGSPIEEIEAEWRAYVLRNY